MSYTGISVRKAIEFINAHNNGWYLPAIQRPYVWGSRHENELYICKLFDSIVRGYPIGGLIIWNTGEKIPYREFMTDYTTGETAKLVEQGLHEKKDKWLVYDGQQRLQTLYSCLRYSFNEQILVFNLLNDHNSPHDPDETGFSFYKKNSKLPSKYIRLNELFSKHPDEKTSFRKKFLSNGNFTEKEELIIESNIDNLWKIFVETDKSSLAYFPIESKDENEVNEIFERLNTGGMELSLSDLLFSRIKGNDASYDFEEKLQLSSKEIFNKTGKGFIFNAYNMLQIIHLYIKNRVRIDPKKVKDSELPKFLDVWRTIEEPLHDFYEKYLWGQFKINNSSIIPRKLSLYPIIIYFHEIYKKGNSFKDIEQANLTLINKFLIISQINDWNLQSYIDNFTQIIKKKSKETSSIFLFPLSDIIQKVEETKKRNSELNVSTFKNYHWFSLKILTPHRVYQFEPDLKGRFNPEIDHIFPKKLSGEDEHFIKKVDVLWNLQPIKGEINGFKSNHHPYDFFSDKLIAKNGQKLLGSKYYQDYDFVPYNNNKLPDLNNTLWKSPSEFIEWRKGQMISFMKTKYDLDLNQ